MKYEIGNKIKISKEAAGADGGWGKKKLLEDMDKINWTGTINSIEVIKGRTYYNLEESTWKVEEVGIVGLVKKVNRFELMDIGD